MATATIHDVYIELERIEALLRLLIIKLPENTDKAQEAATAEIDAVMAAVTQAQQSR